MDSLPGFLMGSAILSNVLAALGNPSLLSILGSHMFFNMKEAGEHGVNQGTNWGSHTASSIYFVNGPGNSQCYVGH